MLEDSQIGLNEYIQQISWPSRVKSVFLFPFWDRTVNAANSTANPAHGVNIVTCKQAPNLTVACCV